MAETPMLLRLGERLKKSQRIYGNDLTIDVVAPAFPSIQKDREARVQASCNLIVKAVNSRAALRAALEKIAAEAEEFSHGDQNAQSIVHGFAKIARRALEES